MKNYMYLSAALFLVVSCSSITKKTPPNYNHMAFNNNQALVLDARKIEKKALYTPSFTAPNIEHLMPYPLEKAIFNWADANLLTSENSHNTAEFVIKNASIVQETLDEGLIKGGKREIYKANVEIALEITDENGKKTEAIASSWQHYTSPMILTVEAREKIWFEMVKEVTESAGKKLTATIEQFLSSYILD